MTLPIFVTLDNIVRWEQAFTVLSMERCWLFFDEMGLPQVMVAAPNNLALRAQSYLEKRRVPTAVSSVSPDSYVTKVQCDLENTFDELTADYDEETVNLLKNWCLRYIVDDSTATGLWVWAHLLRRLCGLVGEDELSVALPLDSAALGRVCSVVHQYLQPEYMRGVRQRIEAAKALVSSDWDKWLDEGVRHAAGQDKENLSAISIALDLVKNIIVNHRTSQIWNSLNGHISDTEREYLVAWARRQADALGIPG